MVSSMVELLGRIGGWRVGSECHRDVEALVDRAERDGLVGRRLHYALIHPTEGDPAFEITDAGLSRLRELAGDQAAEAAKNARQWYRDHTAKPLKQAH